MIESVQPQGNKLNVVSSQSLAAGACVFGTSIPWPSFETVPSAYSTPVKDHSPEKRAVLPSAQIQLKLSLGGRAHGGSGGTFPFSD